MTIVAQIFPHYFPTLAGAAERFRRYAPGLSSRGVSSSVITTKNHQSLSEFENLDGIINITRVDVGKLPEERDARLFLEAHKILKLNRLQANVAQTIKSDRKLIKHLYCIKKQGKGLISISTMVENDTWGKTFLHQWLNRQLQVLSQRLFDAVVVGSGVMAESQMRFGAKAHKLHIISHGVDTLRFCPKFIARAELIPALPANAKVCLSVGNLIPRKGIHTILESWNEIIRLRPDAWLVLVGGIDRPTISTDAERLELEAYQKRLLNLIEQIPQVIYAGQHSDIEKWYQCADLFVFPSQQEGFPNALLEAMSTGLPCFTSKFLGFPTGELDEDNGTIAIVNDTPGDWIGSILKGLNDVNLRATMGLRARQLILRNHDLSVTLDKYAELYHLNGHKVK